MKRESFFQRLLVLMSELPYYSINNILLVLYQRPKATFLQDECFWRSNGRNVIGHERQVFLFVPNHSTNRAELSFKQHGFYDVSQTEGDKFSKKNESLRRSPITDFEKNMFVKNVCLSIRGKTPFDNNKSEFWLSIDELIRYYDENLNQAQQISIKYIISQRYGIEFNVLPILDQTLYEDALKLKVYLSGIHAGALTIVRLLDSLLSYKDYEHHNIYSEGYEESLNYLTLQFGLKLNCKNNSTTVVQLLDLKAGETIEVELVFIKELKKYYYRKKNGLIIPLVETSSKGSYRIISVPVIEGSLTFETFKNDLIDLIRLEKEDVHYYIKAKGGTELTRYNSSKEARAKIIRMLLSYALNTHDIVKEGSRNHAALLSIKRSLRSYIHALDRLRGKTTNGSGKGIIELAREYKLHSNSKVIKVEELCNK